MPGLISEEDIDQVRERNKLVEVVSEYVTLNKRGRLHWGRCPFHSEKTPSFKVDEAMQLWHCFGCGEGGNVFSFVMKIEHVDFPEAVEILAKRVNYEIKRAVTKSAAASRREKLFEANEAAAVFYSTTLRRSPDAAEAREYLKGRGFHIDIATAFDIGFAAHGRDALVRQLKSEKFSEETLVAAGLALKDGGRLRDRFFGRIIFPIRDLKGRVAAFGGRALGDAQPKYLNSSETPVYHKSSILYGLYQAKGEIIRRGKAVVVEGYTDVLALSAAGFTHVVATCGTALTAEHVKLLSRFTGQIVLVFDADAAGMAAAERGMSYVSEYQLPGGSSVSGLIGGGQAELLVAVLPEGKDPADFIANEGAERLQQVLEEATGLVEFVIERKLSGHDLSNSRGRIAAARDALAVIKPLPSPVAREEYMNLIAGKLGVSFESLALELGKMTSRTARQEQEHTSGEAVPDNAQTKAERELLRLALANPQAFEIVTGEASRELFTVGSYRDLFDVISEVRQGKGSVTGQVLFEELDHGMQSLASGLLLDTTGVEDEEVYCREILARLKEFEIGRQIDRRKAEIERANRLKDPKAYDCLFDELIELEARRRKLKDEARGGAVVAD